MASLSLNAYDHETKPPVTSQMMESGTPTGNTLKLNTIKDNKSESNVDNKSENNILINDNLSGEQTRLISRTSSGRPNIEILGHKQKHLYLFHTIIDIPWPKLFLGFFLLLLIYNILFGTIFYWIDGVQPNGVNNQIDWFDCFYFSLQSMDTIGYVILIYMHEYWISKNLNPRIYQYF